MAISVKLKLGDIIEISTPKGLAYAQYTQKHPLMGNLIRVKEGFYENRPPSLSTLAGKKNRIIVFVPLKAMADREMVHIVGNEPIPVQDQKLPVFRNGIRNKMDGTMKWWLWDGEKEWPIGYHLTEEQKHYPLLGTWNDTLLVDRITSGWTHVGAEF